MKEAGSRPNHLRLIQGEGQPPEGHQERLEVTNKRPRTKAGRATLRLVGDSEVRLGTDGEREVEVGLPIVRGRYNKIFKPDPPKAE